MKDGDPASLIWHTPEGIDVKPIYTKDDTKDLTVNQVAGTPSRVTRIRYCVYGPRAGRGSGGGALPAPMLTCLAPATESRPWASFRPLRRPLPCTQSVHAIMCAQGSTHTRAAPAPRCTQ